MNHKEMLKKYPELSPEQVKSYLDGTASPEEQRLIEAIMVDNPLSSDAIEGFEENAISGSEFEEQIKGLNSEIDIITAGAKRSSRRIAWGRYAAAASIILLIGAGALFLDRMQKNRMERAFAQNYEPFKAQDTITDKSVQSERSEVQTGEGQTITSQDQTSSPNQTAQKNLLPETQNKAPEEIPNVAENDLVIVDDFDEEHAPPIEIKEKPVTVEDETDAEMKEEVFVQEGALEAEPTLAFEQPADEAFETLDDDESEFHSNATGGAPIPSTAIESDNLVGELEEQSMPATLSGKVTDAKSGEALFGVRVFDEEGQDGVLTDVEGNFKLELEPGAHRVHIHYLGFADSIVELNMKSGNNYTEDFSLSTEGLALQEVVVSRDDIGNASKGSRKTTLSNSDDKDGITDTKDLTVSVEEVFRQAKTAYQQGDYVGSIPLFEEVLKNQSDHAEALLLCANAYLSTGQSRQAAKKCEVLLELPDSPFHGAAEWYLALAWLDMGREKKATEKLESVAAGTSKYADEAAKLLDELK